MIKITGKLWLLALCLSLIVSIPLASADEKEKIQNDNFYSTNNGNGSTAFEEKVPNALKTWICSVCGYEYVGDIPPETCPNPNCTNPQAGFKEKVPNAKITPSSHEEKKDTEEKIKHNGESNERRSQDDSNYEIFHTILTITPWLLIVLCLIFVWKNIFFLKRKLKTTESQLKKIATPKSEGASELNTNQPKGNDLQLEERVSELERVVSELKEVVRYLLRESETLKKENKEEQRPQESSRWRSLHREIPANNQRIHTENTTRPDQLSNKGISTYSTSNKSGLISGTNRGLGLSSEIQKIIVAFNKMMLDSTKLDEGSVDLWRLRNNFIKDYKVIAFKCVNSQERVNRPEEQPRFESCQASESTLWRIQLSDGTFAVLPGLREYESTVHLQGGMKELFKSGYTSGTYRKIEVVRPAIVRQNFNIAEQGELRLSQ